MYGRDSTLYPRSLEMLDQIDLLDEMDQVGFVARNSVTFDKNGKCVTS
jgi:phenol 2-monooxygenase (NADPH)